MTKKFHLPIDDMQEFAAALGRLLVHSSFLEIMLIQLTAYILSVDVYKAKFVFQEFISTKSKIVLLRRINHYCFPDTSLKETINKYLDKAIKLNSKRNTFVHAFWVVYGDTLARVTTAPLPKYNKSNKPPVKVTTEDIQIVVDEIAELSQSIFDLLFSTPPLVTTYP